MKKYKLAYFVSHPIQYQVPLFQLLENSDLIDFKVFFLCDLSLKGFNDQGFGKNIKWDISLTEGYKYEILSHHLKDKSLTFFNPRVSGVKKALKSDSWDAVWFHGYNNRALLQGMYYCTKFKIPFFFRAESNLYCTGRGYFKDKLVKWIISRASGLLWVSSDNKDYYKSYGVDDNKLFFVPYAVNNDFFQGKVDAADKDGSHVKLRNENKLTEDLPVILFTGKFIKRKNASLLLKAFSDLKTEGELPSAYLIFVGDGEEKEELERLTDSLGVGERVRLTGFKNQTELPAYFNLCDVFVIPSSKEPFGLIVNEVMNASKPIIATDEVGCARDLVKEGENGWIVKAGSREALTTALKNAIEKKDSLAQMGKNSLEIINSWNYEADIKGLYNALKSLDTYK